MPSIRPGSYTTDYVVYFSLSFVKGKEEGVFFLLDLILLHCQHGPADEEFNIHARIVAEEHPFPHSSLVVLFSFFLFRSLYTKSAGRQMRKEGMLS